MLTAIVNRMFQCIRFAMALIVLGLFIATGAMSEPAHPGYESGPKSRDGIGKFYFNREISHVMGHLGARWLERRSREHSERTDLLIDMLPLTTESVVADIGAGTGYFSIPIAKRVPEGEVLAVDIQPEMLAIIKQRAVEANITNIRLVQGTASDPSLPTGIIDVVLLVDAYHEFEFPYEMARGIFGGLKSGGQVVLVEYRAEDPNVAIKRLHKMTVEQATLEWQAAGFRFLRQDDGLPQQHVLIFEKP